MKRGKKNKTVESGKGGTPAIKAKPGIDSSETHSVEIPAGGISWQSLKKSNWFIPLIVLGMLIVLFSLRLINNADIGFHLKGGQWIVENLKFPDKDTFTYTVNNHDYVDMQWLYQVLMYGMYSLFSYAGLTILNVLLLLSVFYMLFRMLTAKGVPVYLTVLSLFLALITIHIRFSYRPEILTWIGILLVIMILDSYYRTGKAKLFLLPVIMLLWVNIHGLFIIGLFIIVVYFVSASIRDKKLNLELLKWLVISTAVTLINPYFVTGATYPFFLMTRLDSLNVFNQNIFELQSPFGLTDTGFRIEIYFYFVIAALSLFSLVLTFKKRKFHEFVILLAFFYISYSAFRNVPIFAIYAIYIIGISINDILNEEEAGRKFTKSKVVKYAAYVMTVVFVLIGMRVVTNAYYTPYGKGIDFGIGINKSYFPYKAAEFINRNKLDGRILNDLVSGGWLEWQLPQKAYIDGRLEVIGEELFLEYQGSFKPNGLKPLVEKYNPKLVIFDHFSDFLWTQQIINIPGWRLLYVDEVTAVYTTGDYAERVAEHDVERYLESKGYAFKIPEEEKDFIISTGAKDIGFTDWLEGFYRSPVKYEELLNLALFAIDNGQYPVAEQIYLYVLKKTRGKLDKEGLDDLYFNLGTIYQGDKQNSRAIVCYRNLLKVDPDNTEAQKRLRLLSGQ